jgi:hypothetical protein
MLLARATPEINRLLNIELMYVLDKKFCIYAYGLLCCAPLLLTFL